MVAAPQVHPSLQSGPLSPASVRPLMPLTSAAAAITPPNVTAAHLNGGDASVCALQPASPAHAGHPKHEEKKVEKVSEAHEYIHRN